MAAPVIPGWQQTILRGVGAPVTPENLLFLNDWTRAEGGGASNNPFNTTQPGYNSRGSYNSVGVQNYGDPTSGLNATIHTLQNGRYGNILAALKQGKSAQAEAQALANSPWGTGALVLKMLGGHVTPSPAGAPSSRTLAQAAVAAPQQQAGGSRQALLAMLQGQLSNYATTGNAQANPLQLQTLLSQYQQSTAPSTLPPGPNYRGRTTAGKVITAPPVAGTPGLTVIPGTSFEANRQILPQVESITKNFGVRVNSAYRSPSHNEAVGGAPHSDHLSGNAIDFVGTQAQMQKLYQWAQGKFPYVEPWSQAGGNHVHISFIR